MLEIIIVGVMSLQVRVVCSMWNILLLDFSFSAFPDTSLGFTIFREVFAYVTLFNPTIEVATFRLHGCVFVAGIHPSRT